MATCHCGAIEITLSRQPDEVVDCNCSLCRRYGVLWAYYEASEIEGLPPEGATETYSWNGRHVVSGVLRPRRLRVAGTALRCCHA
ncbi:GFA family protein [Devosia sp. A369]